MCDGVVPSPEEEDQRRLSRERKTMIKERIEHINRIKGLTACQGIASFEPMRANARERLEGLRTGDGVPNFSSFEVSGPNLPRCFGMRVSTAALPIADSWQLTPG